MKIRFGLILILGSILLSSNTLQAQRFTFNPSNTWEQEYYKDDYSSNKIYIINETNEALAFRWRFVSSTFPDDWSFSICDLGKCFPVPPDSNDMSLTAVGGDAYFICHTSYNGFVGVGEIQLFLFEIGDEANGDTVTFRYSTTDVLGTEPQNLADNRLALFPNPASDIINLKIPNGAEITEMRVYNILGQPVVEKNKYVAELGNVIRVGHLKPGQYFLTVLYANGERETRVFHKTHL